MAFINTATYRGKHTAGERLTQAIVSITNPRSIQIKTDVGIMHYNSIMVYYGFATHDSTNKRYF